MNSISRDDKARVLLEHGLIKKQGGDVLINAEGVALLSGIPADEWSAMAKQGVPTDPASLQRMRRSAKEQMAKYGSDDQIEVMYAALMDKESGR